MALMSSLLVANRGEIACRIMRSARRLGIRTVAIYSEADAGSAHVRASDQAILVGGAAASDSYLAIDKVLEAARLSEASAVHPGYGFLSENAQFAEKVLEAGLIWVGPTPSSIRAMGLKDSAKRLMQQAGVPVTPGFMGEDQSLDRLAREAAAIGWPVLIKAVAGGGGKGMRRVDREEDFAAALAGAQREAAASFGDARVLLEKYITSPRHIEVQIFGDAQGRVVHLFERDCSLQRRHQKVIEEAPAPGMDAATRAALCASAVRAGEAVGYQGAGTIEFIADASDGLRADRIWFMEMNTRLQVEHPVTEAITGLDLVEWQLRIACGEPVPLAQSDIAMRGHAIEARLYAEDPATGFLPSTGRLLHYLLPGDIRVDSGFEEGDAVTPFYDPMIAKLIVHADSREVAAARLARACAAVEVWPVKTNASFLAKCAGSLDFVAARVDTGFIADHLEELTARSIPEPPPTAVASMAARELGPPGPWTPGAGATGFRLNAPRRESASVFVDGVAIEARVDFSGGAAPLRGAEGEILFFRGGSAFSLSLSPTGQESRSAASDGAIRAPMPGRVVQCAVGPDEVVAAGQTIVVLEAMKMEHSLTAPFAGRLVELAVSVGDHVSEGTLLAQLKPAG